MPVKGRGGLRRGDRSFGRSDYRRDFWRFALPLLVRGNLEPLIRVGLMGHHLIMFARGAAAGHHNASHYSSKVRVQQIAAE